MPPLFTLDREALLIADFPPADSTTLRNAFEWASSNTTSTTTSTTTITTSTTTTTTTATTATTTETQ